MLILERKIVLNTFVNVMVLVYYMHSSYWMFTVIFLTWNVLSNLPYCVTTTTILQTYLNLRYFLLPFGF